MNLNQVTIPSIDLEVSIPFYQKLGLKLIVKSLPLYARFEFPGGDSTLSLHRVDALPQGNGIVIYFECDNLDGIVQELIGDGVQFDELPADKPWLWREARLGDPDDNQIILYYAGTNRKTPPWRLQS